ncbi:hypothetical protein Tco_0633721 [Tanacetum coccineum]
MSTQQDIYTVGSENRHPMLNKDKNVSWSSCLLCYAKSKPNRKLLLKSILEGPYLMNEEPSDPDQTKQVEADNQAIQTILMGLLEDIYAAEKEAKLLNELERFASIEGESIESYYHRFAKLMNDLDKNQLTPKKIACNLKFLNNLRLEWKLYVTRVHQTKKMHDVDYNQLYDYLKQNQEEVNEVKAERLARTYDPLAFMANTQAPYTYLGIRLGIMQYKMHGIRLCIMQFKIWVLRMVEIIVPGIANQNRNGNVIATRAESNDNGNNANQIRCYNWRGVDGPADVHQYENCYNNEIFNMVAQEEQYIELLESTTKPHLVQRDDSNVIPADSSIDPSGGEVEQLPITIEETRAFYESLYNNLVIEVEIVCGAFKEEIIVSLSRLIYRLSSFLSKVMDLL